MPHYAAKNIKPQGEEETSSVAITITAKNPIKPNQTTSSNKKKNTVGGRIACKYNSKCVDIYKVLRTVS